MDILTDQVNNIPRLHFSNGIILRISSLFESIYIRRLLSILSFWFKTKVHEIRTYELHSSLCFVTINVKWRGQLINTNDYLEGVLVRPIWIVTTALWLIAVRTETNHTIYRLQHMLYKANRRQLIAAEIIGPPYDSIHRMKTNMIWRSVATSKMAEGCPPGRNCIVRLPETRLLSNLPHKVHHFPKRSHGSVQYLCILGMW